jgi:Flp pilus assembly protein TadG
MKILLELFSANKHSKGQSIVEISLITPLLLVALAVPADFGVAFFMTNIMGTVARDGARIGSEMGKSGGDETNRNFTSGDAVTVKDAVVPKLPAYITGRSVRVKFYEDTAVGCLEVVEVTVSGNYTYFFYQILRLFGVPVTNPVSISRTTQMPYRYQPYVNETRCAEPAVIDELYSNV